MTGVRTPVENMMNCFSATLSARCLTTEVSGAEPPPKRPGWHSRQTDNNVGGWCCVWVCVHTDVPPNFAGGFNLSSESQICITMSRTWKEILKIIQWEVYLSSQFIQDNGSDSSCLLC